MEDIIYEIKESYDSELKLYKYEFVLSEEQYKALELTHLNIKNELDYKIIKKADAFIDTYVKMYVDECFTEKIPIDCFCKKTLFRKYCEKLKK